MQRWAPDNGEGISLFGLRKPGTGSDDMQASSTTYRYTPAGLEVEEPAGAAEGFQEKVTRGVAVRASARLIADRSHVVRGEIKRFLFAYRCAALLAFNTAARATTFSSQSHSSHHQGDM